jgi:hypothetical protein
MTTSRRKSSAVALGVTALLAAALTGCSSDDDRYEREYRYDASDADYEAVCVDQTTEERVPEQYCVEDDGTDGTAHGYYGGHHTHWYYVPRGYSYPGIGTKVRGGSYTRPASSYTVRKGGGSTTTGTSGGGSSSYGSSDSGSYGSSDSSTTRGGFGGSSGRSSS